MSLSNPHYIPASLVVPAATALAFVHGDPNHIHVEIVKDNSTGTVAWQTTPVTHPGSSDIKVLAPGLYSVSDLKYPPMTGTIKVESNLHSHGNLVIGGFLSNRLCSNVQSQFWQLQGFKFFRSTTS